ncbi:methionyl-tRNA formyltransferase [Candidatus Berkelbacteria bacterium]|nr:methionyl-tRNA formyltransferase [Candidatus Berkelbacteria bacterium]
MRIIFLGTSGFVGQAGQVFELIAHSAYRPSVVITEPDKPVGRKQIVTPPPVKQAAEALGISVRQPINRGELLAAVQEARADLAIVAAYGRILRPDVLASVPRGFLNIHPSLLPRYRGPTPVQAAILADDTTTGVTIMQLDEGMDTGPMLGQQAVLIEPGETAPELAERLAELGTNLLLELLPNYLDGTVTPQPQAITNISVTKLLTKESGELTGTQQPSLILRMLRAYQSWPGVWADSNGQRIILHSAHLENGQLVPDHVQLAGKKPVDWSTFKRDRPNLAEKFMSLLNSPE